MASIEQLQQEKVSIEEKLAQLASLTDTEKKVTNIDALKQSIEQLKIDTTGLLHQLEDKTDAVSLAEKEKAEQLLEATNTNLSTLEGLHLGIQNNVSNEVVPAPTLPASSPSQSETESNPNSSEIPVEKAEETPTTDKKRYEKTRDWMKEHRFLSSVGGVTTIWGISKLFKKSDEEETSESEEDEEEVDENEEDAEENTPKKPSKKKSKTAKKSDDEEHEDEESEEEDEDDTEEKADDEPRWKKAWNWITKKK